MAPAALKKLCLFLVLQIPLSFTSAQVPSNYVPLDQVGRALPKTNSVRASTYQENEERNPSVRASTVQNAVEEGQSVAEEQDSETISNIPLASVATGANGIEFSGASIVALGSDPVRAYTAEDYPGIGRGAVQRVKDTQSQYAESLGSQDIVNLLGRPFLNLPQGSGNCRGGGTGQFFSYYYLIREGVAPKSMAVVRFCADGMQSITTQSLR